MILLRCDGTVSGLRHILNAVEHYARDPQEQKRIKLTAATICGNVSASLQNLSMSDRDNPTQATDDRTHFIALGNRYLEAGYLHAAHTAFAAARSKDKLIAVGDRFLQSGMLNSAKDAYIAAGKEIAKEEIVATLLEQPPTSPPKQPTSPQVRKPRKRKSSRSSLTLIPLIATRNPASGATRRRLD